MNRKAIGIRNYAKGICYAILERVDGKVVMLNQHSESFIPFPKGLKTEIEKLQWGLKEFEAIFSNFGPFEKAAVKENESTQSTRYSRVKQNAYLDAAAIVVASAHHVEVCTFVYQNFGESSKTIVARADTYVKALQKEWTKEMADAIVATVSIL